VHRFSVSGPSSGVESGRWFVVRRSSFVFDKSGFSCTCHLLHVTAFAGFN
jgi:hypothetical protein